MKLIKVFSVLILFALAACNQSAPAKQKPNILFCIMDDASPRMSAFVYDWCKTPSFDELAQHGILFTNAYAPNAKCAPSGSSVLTGRPGNEKTELTI